MLVGGQGFCGVSGTKCIPAYLKGDLQWGDDAVT